MAAVANAAGIVATIFLMIGLGMLLAGIGWIHEGNGNLLSRLVVKVALPCTIVNTMLTRYDAQTLLKSLPGIGLSLLTILVMIPLGMLLAKLFRIPQNRRGVFQVMFAFSNTVFIGLPVAQALFGDDSVPTALIYYIANTTLFWMIGFPLLRRDGGCAPGKMNVLARLERILPLPLLTFFVSAILVLLDVTLPDFFMRTVGYVGNLVTPLSLMYTGYIMMRMIRAGHLRWQRGYLGVILGRFVFAPAIILLAAGAFPISKAMRDVLLIQAAMPVMTQTVIVAGSVRADDEYAAGGLTLTTALSIVSLPLYMLLIR